jgi:hypothetical protein
MKPAPSSARFTWQGGAAGQRLKTRTRPDLDPSRAAPRAGTWQAREQAAPGQPRRPRQVFPQEDAQSQRRRGQHLPRCTGRGGCCGCGLLDCTCQRRVTTAAVSSLPGPHEHAATATPQRPVMPPAHPGSSRRQGAPGPVGPDNLREAQVVAEVERQPAVCVQFHVHDLREALGCPHLLLPQGQVGEAWQLVRPLPVPALAINAREEPPARKEEWWGQNVTQREIIAGP